MKEPPFCPNASYHDKWINAICPECAHEVDEYGNTESDPMIFCRKGDCGCDGPACPMGGIIRD